MPPRRGPNLMCNSCYTRNPFSVLMLVMTLLPAVAVNSSQHAEYPQVQQTEHRAQHPPSSRFIFKKNSPTVLSTFMPPYPDFAPHHPLLHEMMRRHRPGKNRVPEPRSAPDEEHVDPTSTTHVAYLSANSRRTYQLPASVATNSVSKTHTDFLLILTAHTECNLHDTIP